MRMPLVFSITCLIGRRRAAAMISRICGWMVGSPPEICTRSGSPSLAHQRVEHALDLGQAAVGVPLGRGIGEADRAGEVAGLVDLDDGQAGMLLVVGAEAAIPRTAALGAGVRLQAGGRRASGIPGCAASRPDRPTPGSSSRRARDSAWNSRCRRPPRRSWPAPGRGRSRTTRWSGRGRDRARTYALCHRTSRPPLRIMTAAYRTRPRQTTWKRLNGPITVA